MGAGAQTLALLGTPRIYLILRSLAEGPKGQLELRRDAGSPAQSTLRGHLRELEATGAIATRKRDAFPGSLEYELTEPGRELILVIRQLERWLAQAPSGPLEPGTNRAKASIKGFIDGLTAGILDCLAERPLSLTELDKRLTTISYPMLERRLETMRLAEQIEAGPRTGNGTPYRIDPWLRRAIGPLVAAARWEYRHRPSDASPIARAEIEAALTVVAPLLEVASGKPAVCELWVQRPDRDGGGRSVGSIEIGAGRLSLNERPHGEKPAVSASGSPEDWFAAIVDGEVSALKTGGKRGLLRSLLEQIHAELFADRQGIIPASVR